ncbi:hypothetical protein [Cryptosporangium sp. NPDC051539]|uniref:hypothetical protein n=1 Tax=Cryptosporangium sp. NPDC051539 TaxID=3363962 RepID=UPI0037AA7799
MTDEAGEPDATGPIPRSLGQGLRVALTRPSVWLISITGYLACYGLFALVAPHWFWSLFGAVAVAGVITPLVVRRMRVLDRRELAEGRIALPEPRLLPSAALDPRRAELQRTVDAALRRLARVVRFGQVFFLGFAAVSVWLLTIESPDTGTPTWARTLLLAGGCVLFSWLGGWKAPRSLRRARAARTAFARGSLAKHVGRVVGVGLAPIVAISGRDERFEVRCEWMYLSGVRPDDEVLIVGDWRAGAAVLLTVTGRKGPRSVWGELSPASAAKA